MTTAEKKALAKQEAELDKVPEKRALDETVEQEVETEQIAKKAKTNGITA